MNDIEAIDLILNAHSYVDVFDYNLDKDRYRMLVKLVHPDHSSNPKAHIAFTKLQKLYENGERGVRFTLKSKRNEYDLTSLLAMGDHATLFKGFKEHQPIIAKMVRESKDNDLMERESIALKTLASGYEWMEWAPFFPELVETFRHRDHNTKIVRRVHIFNDDGLEWFTLKQIREAHPEGLNPKDAAWMWRRLLIVLAYTHDNKVIHGGVIPTHVLIQPEFHGLRLVDWCYSSTDSKSIPAIVRDFKMCYPYEVKAKEKPGPETDIYMATRTMEYVMGDKINRPLRAFIQGCILESRKSRPHSAGRLHDEFVDLIERLWGKRKFRAFKMPDSYRR